MFVHFMPLKDRKKLEDRIACRIKRSKGSVFLREDFADLAEYDQVGRGLRQLVQKGIIVKIGYGLYARGVISPISGELRPEESIITLAREVLNRFKIPVAPSSALKAYNEGRSTQVPTGRMIGVKGRISRKIGFDGRNIAFERVA